MTLPADLPPEPIHRGHTFDDPPLPERDALRCRCWCEATEVLVPRQTIRAGHTLTCGRPTCHE